MSRNDLMQEIQRDPSPHLERVNDPAVSRNWGRHSPGPWASEEALRLVQQIFLLQTEASPHMVVFAAVEHGNGCSRICASVAETLARNAPGPVCLVDANFRSPALPALFGTANQHGLADALLWEGPIQSFTKPAGVDNLWLLSCGKIGPDSPNLLSSEGIKGRLAELRNKFSYVIIDAPPLARYADAIALGQMADGLVLVLGADSTRRETAQKVVANLRTCQVAILGAVLNKRAFPIPQKIYDKL
jgi:capsular exopolysaccharide synthesis family protein